jgi:hypothetical protein
LERQLANKVEKEKTMPGYGNFFFEIPIYRCDQNQHANETEKDRDKYIASRFQSAQKLLQNIYERIHTSAENEFNINHWYSWRYNEIIGWIRLYANGTRILGELWLVNKRVSKILLKKRFQYVEMKFMELCLDGNESSINIFEKITNEIMQLNKTRCLRKRYIDTEVLQTIGPFIDWRHLLGLNKNTKGELVMLKELRVQSTPTTPGQ